MRPENSLKSSAAALAFFMSSAAWIPAIADVEVPGAGPAER